MPMPDSEDLYRPMSNLFEMLYTRCKGNTNCFTSNQKRRWIACSFVPESKKVCCTKEEFVVYSDISHERIVGGGSCLPVLYYISFLS
jgi:hypothetical protein